MVSSIQNLVFGGVASPLKFSHNPLEERAVAGPQALHVLKNNQPWMVIANVLHNCINNGAPWVCHTQAKSRHAERLAREASVIQVH
jgi:hypothetical protein